MEDPILKNSEANIGIKTSSKKLYYLIIGIVILAVLINVVYFLNQFRKVQKTSSTPAKAAEDVKTLTAKVGQLIELPKSEEPSIAIVSNKEKLKDQPFFANAQNGDKVLIYTKSKKAILYRPSINKIIEVSFLNFGVSPTPIVIPTSVAVPTPTPILEPSSTPTIPQGPNFRY